MEHALSLAAWAQEMATIAERKTRAQDQQQHTSHLSQTQAETVWVTGMDQVVRILTKLVQALKHTQRFPDLSVLSYAQSPQGTTTYMRLLNRSPTSGTIRCAPEDAHEEDHCP
jgi:hypothetical protein